MLIWPTSLQAYKPTSPSYTLFRRVLSTVVILSFFLPFSISAQTVLITDALIDTNSLSTGQLSAYNKIMEQDYYLSTRIVNFGDLPTIQTDGYLSLQHPDKDCIALLKAKHVRSDDSGDFYWYGEVEKEITDSTANDVCDCYDGYVNFMKKGNVTIGDIQIDDDYYGLEDLGEGKHLVVKKDTSLNQICGMSDEADVSNPDSLKIPKNPGAEKNHSNCPVKVLALYTDYAMEKVSNLESKIPLFIEKTNQALRNSQVTEKELEFVLVGMQEIEFNDEDVDTDNYSDEENVRIAMNVLLDPTSNSGGEVVSAKNATGADIVIVYSHADHGDIIGTSGSQTLVASRAVILISKGGYDNWTTAHELGHILGCFHEIGGPTVPSSATYEHAHKVDVGLCNTKKRNTIVFSSSKFKTLGYYSNPNVEYKNEKLGTVNLRENWRVMRDNACTVAGFVDSEEIGELIAIWDAPTYACRCELLGITTDVAGGDGTYSYKWYASSDGFNWGSVISTSDYLTITVPQGCPNPSLEHLFIKLEVESDGQKEVLTRKINAVDQIPGSAPCTGPDEPFTNPGTGKGSSNIIGGSGDVIVEIYPNPFSEKITINVKEELGKDVLLEMFNSLGQLVYRDAKKEPASPISIDMGHLSAGTYLLKVNGSEVRKIMKQ